MTAGRIASAIVGRNTEGSEMANPAQSTKAASVRTPPERGLSPEDALKRWSDRQVYAEMESLSEWAGKTYSDPSLNVNHRRHSRLREALEKAFEDRLRNGSVLCSGVTPWGNGREVINPAQWAVFLLEYDFEEAGLGARRFSAIEFFEPDAIPLNITDIPAWLISTSLGRPGFDWFSADETYEHLTIDGETRRIGLAQARVIRRLYETSIACGPDQGWVDGKELLELAGTNTSRFSDLFKSENGRFVRNSLILSDRRGKYRFKTR